MELSQFKGAAEIGAVVRHVGDALTSGERLLPADGSIVNAGIYPQLAAKVKTNVKPIKWTSSIGAPLASSNVSVTRMRFPVWDLANNYILATGTISSTYGGYELTGGTPNPIGDVASRYYAGRPSFSANRQKKVSPWCNDAGQLWAHITTTGQPMSTSLTPGQNVSASGALAGTGFYPSLMRADGSLAFCFGRSAAGANRLAVFSSPLTTATTAWTAATPATLASGNADLTGEAYGNANLSLMVLGQAGSVLKTTDNGATFTRKTLNPEAPDSPIVGLVAHPDGLTSLCRQGNLLFVTSDGWETWRTIPPPPIPEGAETIALASAGIEEGSRNIYALYRVWLMGSTGSQITHAMLRSTDHGATWSDLIVQPGVAMSASLSLYECPLMIPANPTYFFAAYRQSSDDQLVRFDISQGKILPFQAGWKIVADRV
jgi:hypothetical protein